MAQVTVTVSVKDTQPVPAAVDGVLIKVYTAAGVFVTSGTTGAGANAAGQAEFQLDGVAAPGTTYRLRFRKDGASITNPQDIKVTDPPAPTNIFDVVAELHTLPTASDANMCRCSATFVDSTGKVLSGLRILLHPKQAPPEPQILGSGDSAKGLVGRTVEVVTDTTGLAKVDLPREGEFDAVVAGQENDILHITVPNASAANLAHVLWPSVVNVAYSPVSPVAVAAGQSKSVDLALTWTSKATKFTGAPPLLFESSDTAVATAQVSGTGHADAKVVIVAGKAGAATLTPKRVWASGYDVVARPALAALPGLVVNVA